MSRSQEKGSPSPGSSHPALSVARPTCTLSDPWKLTSVPTTENMPTGARGASEGGPGAAGGRSTAGMLPRGPEARDPGPATGHQGPVGGDGHLHDSLSQVGLPGTLPGLCLQLPLPLPAHHHAGLAPPPRARFSSAGISGDRMFSRDSCQLGLPLSNYSQA